MYLNYCSADWYWDMHKACWDWLKKNFAEKAHTGKKYKKSEKAEYDNENPEKDAVPWTYT